MTDEQVEKRAEELFAMAFAERRWPRVPEYMKDVWRDAARAELEKES